MALLLPSLFSSVSFTQGFAPPNKGEYFWEFPAADCMPDDELSSCPVNSTIAECKFLCINTPNCGCVACVCLFIASRYPVHSLTPMLSLSRSLDVDERTPTG